MTGNFYFANTNGDNCIIINVGKRWYTMDEDEKKGYFCGCQSK